MNNLFKAYEDLTDLISRIKQAVAIQEERLKDLEPLALTKENRNQLEISKIYVKGFADIASQLEDIRYKLRQEL